MDYKKSAQEILDAVGGKENVAHLEHCSTRLRFTLADKSQVNIDDLEKVPGVLKALNRAQCQVVVGNNVVEVYDEVINLIGKDHKAKTVTSSKESFGKQFMQFVISIFQPLVPAIAGAGVLKSLLLLLSTLSILPKDDSLYRILIAISDASFYFLPIMVAVTTANALKSNRLVAVGAVGFLLLPQITTMISEGISLFGFQIPVIAYNAQVFPAILMVSFLALLERGFNKISPKSIRIFFVPMMSLAITIPVTLLILGPLGFYAGQLMTSVILAIYGQIGFLAVAILAAILPFMIATGMHKALLPYAVSFIGEFGYEVLYMSASLAHNISEAGACFGVALKTKDVELRSASISAGISALMGITEPALYGVVLQNKRALYGVILGGSIGGTFLGLLAVKAFVLVGPGLASMTMFVDAANSMNLWYAVAGFAVSFIVSIVTVMIIWKDATSGEVLHENEAVQETVTSPFVGDAVEITSVNDELIALKTLGDGLAIIPQNGEIYAPVDGEVVMVFDTKHSIGFKSLGGVELLMHIGIDTVNLNGKGFDIFVKENDVVKKGDLIGKVDLEYIKSMNLDPITALIVTNGENLALTGKSSGSVGQGSVLFTVEGGI